MYFSNYTDLEIGAKELWPFLVEIENIKQWNTLLLDFKPVSEGPLRKGFIGAFFIEEKISKTWYQTEILSWEENKRMSFALSDGNLGKQALSLEYHIQSLSKNSVRLKVKTSWKAVGIKWKLAEPILKQFTQRVIQNSLQQLKQLISKLPK